MKKAISGFVLLLNLALSPILYAVPFTQSFQVKQSDIYRGYIIEKISLTQYAVPTVTISDITFATDVTLPKDAKLSDPNKLLVSVGVDRKKNFAVVHIPAFTGTPDGKVTQVSSFTLTIDEPPVHNNPAAKTTDAANSALASGTWYKIGITKTGFYKIDYNFIKNNLGLDPTKIDPTKIRVFGNGGHMLAEANSVSRPSDLVENAIFVSTGGGSLGSNDYFIFYGVGTTAWTVDSASQTFVHQVNLYADTAYYFLNFGDAAGLRLTQQSAPAAGNVTVSGFSYYDEHELELVNPPELGKNWYGETFMNQLGNLTQSFSFSLGAQPISSVYCIVSFGCTSENPFSTFTVTLNNSTLGTSIFQTATPAGGDDVMALQHTGPQSGSVSGQTANVGITFTPADATGVGYLNYIEINTRLPLYMTADQMSFRDLQSVNIGNTANYQLGGANGSTTVWDITNPRRCRC